MAAASSLQLVVDELVADWSADSGRPVAVSYAGSQTLALQLEAGAPYALYLAADQDWLDYVMAHLPVDPDSATTLASNRLVFAAPRGRCPQESLLEAGTLASILEDDRLAIGNTEVVPAGRYARAALIELGLWSVVADRLAPMDNVRLATLQVATGELPLGLVYATDAQGYAALEVCAVLPADSHPPIRYGAVLTASADASAAALLRYLASPAARPTWARHGFLPPPD